MTLLINKLIKSTKSTFCFCTLSVLFSCTNISKSEMDRISNDIIDPNSGLTRDQFKNSLSPLRKKEPDNTKKNNESTSGEYKSDPYSEPAIPEISSILTTPTPSSVLTDKLISISVTEDIPLKDVLIELSRLADVDMEIDPGITGGIILRVTDKPFNEVIERVVDLGGLRYKVIKGTIRVERDNPYKKDYKVDYLNMTRTSSSKISVDTNGLGAGAEGASALPSGSSSNTEQTTTSDVWESVQTALNNILAFNEQANITNITSVEGSETSASPVTKIQVNRQAGLISIIATDRQHKSIGEYLSSVEDQTSSQVLIEAKVVEVTLDEQYKSGVDWGTLADKTGLGLAVSGNFGASISSSTDFITLRGDNSPGDMSTAISFTEQFGVARTISSPRLNAMNNQQSVLSFAENTVYFQLQVEEETDEAEGGGSTTTLTVESELKTVPVGVILSLQPSINLETNEITMHVRPTMSRITGTVSDPGVDLIIARQGGNNPVAQSLIPVIEVREMDSVLKIRSGEIMVIGGLMKDEQSSEDKGVPFANRTPILGNLFKSKNQVSKTVETVIFIKATIVKNNDARSIQKFDKDYYNTFAPRDPRPLAF